MTTQDLTREQKIRLAVAFQWAPGFLACEEFETWFGRLPAEDDTAALAEIWQARPRPTLKEIVKIANRLQLSAIRGEMIAEAEWIIAGDLLESDAEQLRELMRSAP